MTLNLTANPNNVPLTAQAVADALGHNVEIEFEQVANIPKELTGPIRWDHPLAAHPVIVDAHAGLVSVTPRRTKVCIVGYAENSRHLAWYDDQDCEIWGVNQLGRFIPRADRWFQIHHNWDTPALWAKGTDQRQWIRESPIPVYMIDCDPDLPSSVRYPLERVMAELKTHDYFTSTIAFMVALAIAEGFETIGIYGIDLIIGREYQFEKPCVEYLLGIANERGIRIHKPDGCALLWQSHRYGYQEEPEFGFYSVKKLDARSKQLEEQTRLLRDEVKVWQGRREEAVWVRERLNEGAQASMDAHIKELEEKIDKALNRLYMHDGAQQEVARMHDILELRHRGGQVA
jgi:hypothetical protein